MSADRMSARRPLVVTVAPDAFRGFLTALHQPWSAERGDRRYAEIPPAEYYTNIVCALVMWAEGTA